MRLTGQFALRGQDVSGLELAAHDSFAENICDLPVERFIVSV